MSSQKVQLRLKYIKLGVKSRRRFEEKASRGPVFKQQH